MSVDLGQFLEIINLSVALRCWSSECSHLSHTALVIPSTKLCVRLVSGVPLLWTGVGHTKHYHCVRTGPPIIMLYRHISYRELSIVILLIVILATTIIIVRPEV